MRIAPHLVRPLQFFLPLGMPRRPAWKIRAGLLLYDWLAGSALLPASSRLDLSGTAQGAVLKPEHRRGFAYWDCWGDDTRLVAANEIDARERGATTFSSTRCLKAIPTGSGWLLTLASSRGAPPEVFARAVVNATGPWVVQFLSDCTPIRSRTRVRLVKGSHFVIDRAPGERALILQHDDGRIVFVLPFERRYTLIGTTDVPVPDVAQPPALTPAEADYLCSVVNRYLARSVSPQDAVWSYAGVRALYDDGTANPSAVTRDYHLQIDRATNGAPILSVFGGKLTTYRRLAEQVVDRLAPLLGVRRGAWTAGAALPGGDMGEERFEGCLARMRGRHPGIPSEWIEGMVRRHGSRAEAILRDAQSPAALGHHFGAGLTAREIDYLLQQELAQDADDVLWRRTKTGLHLDATARTAVGAYVRGNARHPEIVSDNPRRV
jgi:glycerol-3-phosphate dehydrogenase